MVNATLIACCVQEMLARPQDCVYKADRDIEGEPRMLLKPALTVTA